MQCPIEFRLEDSASAGQPYFWTTCRSRSAQQLTFSETYSSRQGAIAAVQTVKAGNATYSSFVGSDGFLYFRIKGRNGLILARSSGHYDSYAAAEQAAALIRKNAADAAFYDYTRSAQRA